MPVQLNIVKTTITPKVRTLKTKGFANQKVLLNQLSDNSRKLKDYGNPDPNPNADSKNESHMAKTTLGGMAAGAATGATIGSVVPIVGTAFGALAGSVVGAVGGAFVGLFTKSK